MSGKNGRGSVCPAAANRSGEDHTLRLVSAETVGEPGMRKFTFRVLMALACLSPGMADAADCSLKLVNTIPITMENQGTRPLVPVIVNGTKETFLLDTGGAITQISMAAAQDLKLPIGDSNVKMLDLYGGAAVGLAHIATLGLGKLQDRNTSLSIMTSTY